MKSFRLLAGLGTACLLMLSRAFAQDGHLGLPQIQPDRSVQLPVSGASNTFQRVDVSTNLLGWFPLDLLKARGEQFSDPILDTNASSSKVRFYRARQITSGAKTLGIFPSRGAPNDIVDIYGQFTHSNLMQQTEVRFAGLVGQLISATSVRLRVRVPADATTGFVTVQTPDGVSRAPRPFIIVRSIPFQVSPPAGLNPGAFEVVNSLTPAALGPSGAINIRKGLSLLTGASIPNDTNRVLMAVTTGSETNLVLSANSTAAALVFMWPGLVGSDPGYASQLLQIISTNSKVLALGTTIANLFNSSGDPYTNSVFHTAYVDAVRSVVTNGQSRALFASVLPTKNPPTSSLLSAVPYSADLEYTTVSTIDDDDKPLLSNQRQVMATTGPRFPFFNSVDWFVKVQEVDVELAYPNGRDDFNRDWRENRVLKDYPTTGLFEEQRNVEAELITERLSPLKFLADEAVDYVKGKLGELTGLAPDESLRFQDRNGLYLVRAIGPGFYSSSDVSFAVGHYPEEYTRVMAQNIVSAVVDLVGIFADEDSVEEKDEEEKGEWLKFMGNLLMEANKSVPNITSPNDFTPAVVDLVKWTALELAGGKLEGAAEAVTKKVMKKLADTFAGAALEGLDTAASAGQVAQRVIGMGTETSLETAFVVVGDPFSLEIISVDPAAASPGTEVTVTFRGRRTTEGFRIGQDSVWFEGPDMFEGTVLLAIGPQPDGTQQLVVKVPEAFGSSADGTYKVAVNSRGWRGEGTFRLTSKPEVRDFTPTQGFAATGTYAGTKVRLRGINFKLTNDFSFTGSSGWIIATNKSGTDGDVSVRVPAGAMTGPIRIVRNNVNPPDEVQTAPFTVLGPPVINSVTPTQGPIGTFVSIQAQNLGTDANDVSVFFTGRSASTPLALYGASCELYVPTSSQTGPVRLVTPAGEAQFNFTVDPGLASGGGYINVGGASVVTPERAGAFTSGAATPNDDNDFFIDGQGNQQPTDPPYEEGDFVPDTHSTPRFTVGTGFADSILVTGTVTGNIGLDAEYDSIGGATGAKLVGNILIAGNYCSIGGIEIEGTLTISGRNNFVSNVKVSNSSGDGIIVTGSGNNISATVSNVTGNGVVISSSGNSLTLTVNGSHGNGIVFSGNARNNQLQGTSISNQFDGLVLSGSGVSNNLISGVRNNYSFQANFNGGNGVSIINGANSNIFGYWQGTISGTPATGSETFVPLITDGNAAHGVLISNSIPTQFWAQSTGNGRHGVLVTGISGGATPLPLYVQTGANTNLSGNALAGVRIEGSSSNLLLLGSMSRDRFGVQLEGTNVQKIRLGNEIVRLKFTSAALSGALYVRDCISHGVTLTNTSGHQIHVEDILRCGGDGLVLYNSSSNDVRLSECVQNVGVGVRLTANSSDNTIDSFKVPLLLANVRSNLAGIQLEGGAHGNYIEGMDLIYSKTHGLIMTGVGTTQNRIQRSGINGSLQEGVFIENGASGNFIGPDHKTLEPVNAQNHTNGIARITGRYTTNNVFRNIRTILNATNAVGFVVEDESNGNVFRDFFLSNLRDGIVLRGGAFQNTIQSCFFQNFTGRAILLQNASNNIIGSAVVADGNTIFGNRVNLEIDGAGSKGNWIANNRFTGAKEASVLFTNSAAKNLFGPVNTVQSSLIGIQLVNASDNLLFQNIVSLNIGPAAKIEGGASRNNFRENTVFQNGGGILLSGATTLSNSITRNSVTDNAGLGIDLTTGANRLLSPPRILEITTNLVSGEADGPDGSVVEIFQDASEEGQTFLTSAPVAAGRFKASVDVDPFLVGLVYRINATLTDLEGNTSEFSLPVAPTPIPFRAAFTTTRDGNEEIYLHDPTLAAPTRITFHASADYSASLNGTNIAWVSTRSNNIADIFVTTPAGFPVQRLTTNSVPDYDPAWFADNSRIAFVSERDGNPELYVMNANGSGAIRLTTDAAADVQPCVSPDGTKIAFASQRDGNFEIYTITTTGSSLQRITTNSAADIHPSWSPDGQQIAFASDRDVNSEIYVMNADGTGQQRLTNDGAQDTHPTWLPGGNGLLFASNRCGHFELYVMAKTGGPATRLTFTNGESYEPWVSAK